MSMNIKVRHSGNRASIEGGSKPDDYRQRVMSCWLGKAVGGTLGTPFEGQDGPFHLTFYSPVPEKMLANDDLDLQVVWACVMDKLFEVRVDRHILAQAWLDHVRFPFSEYAVALRNLRLGIKPPVSGSYDNWFANNMGAAIRTELWACLAPGNPRLAADYAYEDACVDHAEEGVWAAMFLAALESTAFCASDPQVLLDTALPQLPADSLVRRAVQDTRKEWAESHDWLKVRERILERYYRQDPSHVVMNMAFIVLGWLAGEGDFSKAICTAANCGKDTDCTAATVGALMGIIAPSSIPARWLKPVGRDLVLSPQIRGIQPPATLDAFTDLVIDLGERLRARPPASQALDQSTEPFRIRVDAAFSDWKSVNAMRHGICQMPAITSQILLPGALATLERGAFRNEVLLLKYAIHLDASQTVRLVFNTPQESWVWVDGAFRFGREGGSMIPSPHRAPVNQFCDLHLEAGSHEVIAAIGRPDGPKADWLIALADAVSFLWIPDVFNFAGKACPPK